MSPRRKVPVAPHGDHMFIVQQHDGTNRVATVETEYTFAFELRSSARAMSNLAESLVDVPDNHRRRRAFIYGAIVLSYTSLEAALNEFVHLHALIEGSPLNEVERALVHVIGREKLVPKGESNTLQKFNFFLRLLGKSEIASGSTTYQNANLVRMLRNMVVHPLPGRVKTFIDSPEYDYSSQQDIVKKLRGALGLRKSATFPRDIITEKCAAWAVHSCEAFLHEFVLASGIDFGFVTDPRCKNVT